MARHRARLCFHSVELACIAPVTADQDARWRARAQRKKFIGVATQESPAAEAQVVGRHPVTVAGLHRMIEYCVGIEDHYAWANLVSVGTGGHDTLVLDSRRVTLLDPPLAVSPYHHDTRQMAPPEAEQLVLDVRASANKRASAALSSLISDLAPATCRGVAIRVPPLPHLPATVAEAHADAHVMNRADGMIYHQALTHAAAELQLTITHFEKHTVLPLAARAHGITAQELERRLKALGTTHGPPWRKGHVLACAGAILAHVAAPH